MHRLGEVQPCPMPTVDGIKEYGFHLVSRFRDTASLYYVYTGPRSHKLGRPKTLDGKINYKTLALTRMAELHIGGLKAQPTHS